MLIAFNPSISTVGDSYDNALVEIINRPIQDESIKTSGPWRTVEPVEVTTVEWVG